MATIEEEIHKMKAVLDSFVVALNEQHNTIMEIREVCDQNAQAIEDLIEQHESTSTDSK